MENNINIEIAEQGSPEVPSLIRYISSSDVAGFDTADSQPPSPYAQVRLFFKHFTCIIEYYKANFQKLSFFFSCHVKFRIPVLFKIHSNLQYTFLMFLI